MIDFKFPINLNNINFNVVTIVFGLYLITIGILYYVIFHKHHKRNKIELGELISLVTKFYSLTMLSTILLYISGYCIVLADSYKYDRSEVITSVVSGIMIASGTIINYIYYIKRHLKDLDTTEREISKKRIIQIGEILEFIFFIIFILMPIWRIPKFIEVFGSKKELIAEILQAFLLSIASLVLLISLNPIDIKQKFKKIFTKKDKK